MRPWWRGGYEVEARPDNDIGRATDYEYGKIDKVDLKENLKEVLGDTGRFLGIAFD